MQQSQVQEYRLSIKDAETNGIAKMANDFGSSIDVAANNGVPLTFKDVRDPKDYRAGVLRLQDQILKKIRQQVTADDAVDYIRDYRFLTRYRKTNPAPITNHENRHFLHDRFNKYNLCSERAQRRRGMLFEDYVAKMTLFSMFTATKTTTQTSPATYKLMEQISQF